MSPEQARGQAVDKRADIWAFGCVLYEMLTRHVAFSGKTISDTIAKILEREPDWRMLPATLPPGVGRLIKRCLDKDSKRRLRDIGDARTDIDDALSSSDPVPVGAARLRCECGARWPSVSSHSPWSGAPYRWCCYGGRNQHPLSSRRQARSLRDSPVMTGVKARQRFPPTADRLPSCPITRAHLTSGCGRSLVANPFG